MRIALATSARHRWRLAAGAAASGVVAAAVLGVVAAGAGGARTLVGRVFLLGVIMLLVALAVLLARAARAPAGWLEVAGDHVTLNHPELLRSSIVVPREAVRTLLVDAGDAGPPGPPGGPHELAAKFPLVETGDAPAWLHPGARSALPLLGWQRTAPNAALVLRGPFDLGASPRRLLALFEGNEELRALATCAGFFLQLADPAVAAAAVAEAGLDAPLTLAEAEQLDGFAADRRPRGNRS